jgi:hypothetical protein
MAQKRKIHDPMKTVTDTVMCGAVIKKRTCKEKRTKHLLYLNAKYCVLSDKMVTEWNQMSKKYNFPSRKDGEPISPEEEKFNKEFHQIFNKYKKKLNELNAESSAIFLIKNNIARRGKPLHADTAIKKLERMQKRGSIKAALLKQEIENSKFQEDLSFPAQAEHNLHYYLYINYGVTLLNASTYKYCQSKITTYKSFGKYGEPELSHWQNFAKKFHAAVINAANLKEKQNGTER